jgi:hypothetical protein
MGSQAAQNQLWSRGADDWAAIQEGTVEDCYRYVLEYLPALKEKRVLDMAAVRACSVISLKHMARSLPEWTRATA